MTAVVIVGRDQAKGAALVDAARKGGAVAEAMVVRADLSLVSENERVVKEIKVRFPTVDALVLCARFFRSRHAVTAEGFEHNLALFYLSRFLLGHGLADAMERAQQPVVVNVAGPGPNPTDIHWDDLGLARNYDGVTALMQGGRLNDLLGAAFPAVHPESRIRYVLVNPGSTATSFAGEYDPPTAAHIESMKRFGKPVEQSVAPILTLLDTPPDEPLSAFVEGRRISVDGPAFDRDDALRLHTLTEKMLSR